MNTTIWVIILIVMICLYILIIYNRLIKLQNKLNEAFATMDVYLKKRWDLVPNLVETIKGYAKHEKETFMSLTELRSGSYEKLTTSSKLDKNIALAPMISKLMMTAEAYPELKASSNFLDLSKQLSTVEDEIANARKYYNAVVRLNNNTVEMIPSNIVANIFAFKSQKMFETEKLERNVKNIELN